MTQSCAESAVGRYYYAHNGPMQSLIYLICHGEIDKPSPRSFLTQTDLPLYDNGIHQAKALREHLKHVTFTKVFSSPLQRAVQTAALVSEISTESLHLIEDLKEINLGAWEGLTDFLKISVRLLDMVGTMSILYSR